jgi:uncharacterized Fe-S cluster-containing MiaB family protein
MSNNPTDYSKPPSYSLFQPVIGARGKRLAIVFGNEGPEGKCPFYKYQCNHCDIGDGEGIQFTSDMNIARLEFFKSYFAQQWPEISHLVIYNYGSTLNSVEFSAQTVSAILEFVKSQQSIKRVSFDSREQFITPKLIKSLIPKIREDQTLAVTIGLESQSDKVRIENLNKKITRQQVESVFSALSAGLPQTAAEINLLFQPPGVAGPDAITEAVETVKFGLNLTEKFSVPVDFNFHPYYPSIKGTNAFPFHPRAHLQDATRALILMIREIKSRKAPTRVFVGWNDEGHDLQPELKQKKLMLYDPAFAAFNQSQEEKDLRL